LIASDLLEELNKCTRCGFCQEVCPTYKAELTEGSVARGRIRLAKIVEEGNYIWSRHNTLSKYINDCLLCGACVSNCPGAIPTNELMIMARRKINQHSGFSLFHKIVYRGALSDQKKLKLGRKAMRFYQATGIRAIVKNTGFLGLIPAIKAMEERMPDIPKKAFFDILPDLKVEQQSPKYRLGYFCGCATNSFFSDVAVSATNVLQKLNCQVTFPRVECCGEPHKSAGDLEEAKRLAKKNIDLFLRDSFDYIVTDCATCGNSLKKYGELLADDEEYREKSKLFSSLVYDLNQFVVQKTAVLQKVNPNKSKQITVTYHSPCHEVRGQKIIDAPRDILQMIPGISFVEMEDADSCCGGAGSYGFSHHRISLKILESKMEKVKATGANCLATSCPACMMQLSYGIRHSELKIKLVHPIQLLEMVLDQ